jgi:cobalamin biosynthesis Mg chelatase CobN
MSVTTTHNGEVTRADIEAKLRAIRGEMEDAGESAKNVALIVGTVAAVTIVGAVYLFGRRRGRTEKTVVEIRRI